MSKRPILLNDVVERLEIIKTDTDRPIADARCFLRPSSSLLFHFSPLFLCGYFSFNTRENTVDYDRAVIIEIWRSHGTLHISHIACDARFNSTMENYASKYNTFDIILQITNIKRWRILMSHFEVQTLNLWWRHAVDMYKDSRLNQIVFI